jgi:dihydroflavonol-4-reductase
MRALVTGASGLIGAHIVRALLNHGHEVRALVRETSRRDALAGLPVAFIVGDVLRADRQLDAACTDCDVVFHAAAHFAYTGYSSAALHDTAVAGTNNILQSCARTGVSRAIVTSSSVVFGYSEAYKCIDGEPPYVAAKIVQHQRTLELGDRLQLDVRLACPTMTLGPTSTRIGPSNGLIAAYLADPFRCTFSGGCNLVSARDVAQGHLLISEHGTAAESYLLGSQNLHWRQIHMMIAELTGVPPPSHELSHTATYLAATADELRAAMSGCSALATREQASMAGRYYWYSHAKAATLGYAPMPARDALVEAISWLAASPHISREVRTGMHLAPDIYRFRSTISAQRGSY